MSTDLKGIILFCTAAFFLVICAKRGYSRGFARELKAFLSVVVAVICVILIVALKGAVSDRQYSVVIVIAGAVIILSLGWKFIRMIIGLLSGFTELPILGTMDALLGSAMCVAEGAALIWIVVKIYSMIRA